MKNKALKIISVSLILGLFSGCGNNTVSNDPLDKLSKQEIITMYRQLEKSNNEMLISQGTSEFKKASITEIGDGTGRMTFNSHDGSIVFPKSFEYPNSKEVPNSSSINITNAITVSPNNNWNVCISSGKIELEHKNGISGTITVGKIDSPYDCNKLQSEVLETWFRDIPSSNILYNNIFLNDNIWGVQAKLSTTIDENDACIRCGMLGFGENSLTYVFVYRSSEDETNEEIISTLLNSVVVLGQNMRVN